MKTLPCLLCVMVFGVLATAAPPADKPSALTEQCAKACADCMRECERCAHHCVHLIASGQKEHTYTLGTCLDCADFCAVAAKVVSRHGPMTVSACEACAKACDVCAAACDKHPEDEHLKRCAKACQDCAKLCRDMVKHTADAGR